MSTPQYAILKRFSEEARRTVAERVFDTPTELTSTGAPTRYACAEGLCVMAALLKADGKPSMLTHPDPQLIGRKLGTTAFNNVCDIASITQMNDRGELATAAAVRALLLGDLADQGDAATVGGKS